MKPGIAPRARRRQAEPALRELHTVRLPLLPEAHQRVIDGMGLLNTFSKIPRERLLLMALAAIEAQTDKAGDTADLRSNFKTGYEHASGLEPAL